MLKPHLCLQPQGMTVNSVSSIVAVGGVALLLCGCSTAALPAPKAPDPPAELSYRQAVNALIAATQTQDDFQSTSMREVQSCRFAFDISPADGQPLGFPLMCGS